MTSSNLSKRGQHAAASLGGLDSLMAAMRNIFDEVHNPDGVVFLGLADNALLRTDVLRWLNDLPLHLTAPELTYADRVCAQSSLLSALTHLFNTVPDGFDPSTFASHRKPLTLVTQDHIVVASGASGVIDILFSAIADQGDALLLSAPYYNGFDHDLDRNTLTVVEVPLGPLAMTTQAESDVGYAGQPCFDHGAIEHYERALAKATSEGKRVRAVLLCNPHNPTGAIIARDAVIDLCKFCAKHGLHLVSDEIYARSVFDSRLVPQPHEFYSVLSIDTLAEAGLHPSYVHVVTSASKDFAVNGFRLGVLISQHNKELINASLANGLLSQPSSVGGAIWRDWIGEKAFLDWYLAENRKRLRDAFGYLARFLAHHKIPFVPSNSGHFSLLDLSAHLTAPTPQAEQDLLNALLKSKVFIAPGAQYHTATPGLFRLTFAQPPSVLREGLRRIERVLGLDEWVASQPVPEWEGPPAEVWEASRKYRMGLRETDVAASTQGLAIKD